MKNVVQELAQLISSESTRFSQMDEKEISYKSSPEKWSKKEVIGHLVDSAQNNIQRFVRAQYQHQPFIVYAQDDWVRLQDYQTYPTADLIQLWILLNRHLCKILENIPQKNYQLLCLTDELHTLEWIAEDYVRHLKHHLKAI